MKITITATGVMTTMDGVPVRVWRGTTADGVDCIVFVHRIAVAKDEDASSFERDLVEQLPPAEMIPLRKVLR